MKKTKTGGGEPDNIYSRIPETLKEELLEILLQTKGFRLERIGLPWSHHRARNMVRSGDRRMGNSHKWQRRHPI